jgi:murein DD-endopeptidase MepM/ murein hydrolase activator NlpD
LPLTSLPSSARPRPRRARGAAPASPLDGPLEISSPFDPARLHPVLGKRLPHLGVDLVAPAGASVRAIDAGVVVAVERRRREGNLVAIEHGRGLESQYWHLRDVDRGVRRGARVRRGEVIGRVGSTGLSTAPHLHLALRRGGRHVDPMTVLGPPRDRAAR